MLHGLICGVMASCLWIFSRNKKKFSPFVDESVFSVSNSTCVSDSTVYEYGDKPAPVEDDYSESESSEFDESDCEYSDSDLYSESECEEDGITAHGESPPIPSDSNGTGSESIDDQAESGTSDDPPSKPGLQKTYSLTNVLASEGQLVCKVGDTTLVDGWGVTGKRQDSCQRLFERGSAAKSLQSLFKPKASN